MSRTTRLRGALGGAALAAVLAAATACGGATDTADASTTGAPAGADGATCAPPPAADVSTAAGWLGWIAEHRDQVTVAFDDGRGATFENRADEAAPTASASKVLHLAAYSRAVAEGALDPEEQVTIEEWERWYAPGTDAGGHPNSLDALGIPKDPDGGATDPARTVRLADMLDSMIRYSDNAVPDYLRDRLGDDALRAAAAAAGWDDPELPSYLGHVIALLDPAAMPADPDRAEEIAAEWRLAQEFAADPARRAELATVPLPGDEAQLAWSDRTAMAPAGELAALHRAVSDGSFGPGADVARAVLEFGAAPDGFAGFGFKGGSLPGVIAEAMIGRRADGSVASIVLLSRGMPIEDWATALTPGESGAFPHQELLVGALSDPGAAGELRCAATGRA